MNLGKNLGILFFTIFVMLLVGLALFSRQQTISVILKPEVEVFYAKPTQTARQYRLAMDHLRETQAEVAKMKAHGIGMPVSSPSQRSVEGAR